MKDNIIYRKSFNFAIDIVNLYKYLINEKREFVISKQLLRSRTSIGANVSEAIEAQSKKDFISKLSIALKETRETKYWIELLNATDYLEKDLANNLLNKTNELLRILVSIIKTSKAKLKQ
ncbi:four helix bundle protein [Caminicella sporogenes DSM 14501]|uniref:Four helix bundle protein n=1 Tax=Caminicella sporogenes DSM 14501 TaxID=1121266 RepID=A0A1M6SWN2_9FIRM|nr:four helix bundle protein [Caminicella sporogenes]RKD21925.1 four helix bundle protein [Caminicella sporogenes]SHK49125.1 four helix bundle protein [Caminicella sporogenes DSM 14501]